MTELTERYLCDLKERQRLATWSGAKLVSLIRKPVKLNDLEEIIEKSAEQTIELGKTTETRAAELKQKKRLNRHERRVAFMVKNRLGFRKDKAFKRSNSFPH